MPKVKGFTTKQKIKYQKNEIAYACKDALVRSGINQYEVADIVGITPQAVGKQLKRGEVSTEVLIAIATITDMDSERLKRLLTYEK